MTYVGTNPQFTKERSEEIEPEEFSTGAVFRLDRALKEGNEEYLKINVLDKNG
ncbi:MAG: hypothetical protein MJ200_02735 [Mycoplasmoidaceae bacterium]|nr:hypothetical protein [Mycoplasmoidaceae bacterium]